MKKAILFDYDGVFADTMGDMYQAWRYSILHNEKIKTPIWDRDFFLMEGYTARKIAEKLCIKYKIDKSHIDTIIKDKEDYYFKHNKFRLYPGIEKTINFIKERGLRVAIVSGAPKTRIEKMIGEKLFNKFDLVIGAGDVKRGKPFPDPYKKALEILNILPSEAIVIENAPLGIKAARAAGIYCVAIESTLDKSLLKEADVIVKNILELKLLLKEVI